MSGLILEGDLEEKFGKNYPTPIIDQVRVYNDYIEADVSIYFKIPDGDDTEVSDFIQTFNAQEIKIHASTPKQIFGIRKQIYQNVSENMSVDYKRKSLVSTASEDTLMYTNTGDRYCRQTYMFHLENEKPDRSLFVVSYGAFSQTQYPDFFSTDFFREDEYSDEENVFSAHFSDASFLTILVNGQIFDTEIEIFIDQNGQQVSTDVLYSLSRTYHKATDFTKQLVEAGVKAIVSEYSSVAGEDTPLKDSIDNILFLLETQIDNPKLLAILNDANKASPYKSSALPVGKFYKDLNTFFFEANRRVVSQEELVLKRFTNIQIVDLRDRTGIQVLESGAGVASTFSRRGPASRLSDYEFNAQYSTFIHNPFFVLGPEMPGQLLAQGVFIFDIDKVTNFKSKLSEYLNIFNIEQIFGNNYVKNFFKIISIQFDRTRRLGSTTVREKGGTLRCNTDNPGTGFLLDIFTSTLDDYLSYEAIEGNFISPFMADLLKRDYPDLSLLGVFYTDLYEAQSSPVERTITANLIVIDTTMQFFYDYIVIPLFEAFEKFFDYVVFARDFCSFNNIDNKFNDFFVNSIEAEFDGIFPWIEIVSYVEKLDALIRASYGLTESEEYPAVTVSDRAFNKDIDLASVEAKIRNIIPTIRPSTGDLVSLNRYFVKTNKVVNFFRQGQGLDWDSSIYKEDFELKEPEVYNMIGEDYLITIPEEEEFIL